MVTLPPNQNTNITQPPIDPFSEVATPKKVMTSTVWLGVVAGLALPITFILVLVMTVFAPAADFMDAAEGMAWLYVLMVPTVLAGAYWLALLRLRRVSTLQTWLEGVALSIVFLVVTGAVMGVGSYYLYMPRFERASSLLDTPWWVLTLFVEAPGPILYVALLAMLTSGVGVGFASLFARWDVLRLHAHLPSRGWLDFLLVFGSGSLMLLLTGVIYIAVPGADTFLLLPLLPGALVGVFASWLTYRQMKRAGLVRPSPLARVGEIKE